MDSRAKSQRKPKNGCRHRRVILDTLHRKNTATTQWLHDSSHGIGNVSVGAHVYDKNAKLINLEFGRTALEKDIDPNEEVVSYLDLCVHASGRYLIRTWFQSTFVGLKIWGLNRWL